MILADNINKSFQGKKRIDSLSFHIPKGEIVGFIGANGAGKTTTIKMLTGTLKPDSGLIRVDGINPIRNMQENLKNIGIVSGISTQLWKDMKLKDSYYLAKAMYKLSKNEFESSMKYLSEKLGLEELINYQVNKLSLGQRMRAEAAYSLLHNPRVLYLDEATVGLDVSNKEKVLNIIKEINTEKGTTILFASNNLSDIEKTCKRIMIIDQGKKIYEGNLSSVRKHYTNEYLLKFKIEKGKIPDFQDLPIKRYKIDGDNLLVYYENNNINASTILKHIIKQCFIKDIKIIEPSLESVIRNIYEEVV
ncbi:MAG: ATP-binding cassette domain-containing protein [Bacillota bacterium]|nr:ATP-binding cassette domain-containing protein [Bacillota bacterium]